MAGMDHSEMSEEETAAMMDKLMVDSMLAYPAETEGVGNQLLDYRVMPDGTKQFELTAAVTPVGSGSGPVRRCLGVQRHGPRSDDQGRRR